MLPDRIAAGPLRYYVMTRTKRLRDFFIGNSGLCIECCKYYYPFYSFLSLYIYIYICTYRVSVKSWRRAFLPSNITLNNYILYVIHYIYILLHIVEISYKWRIVVIKDSRTLCNIMITLFSLLVNITNENILARFSTCVPRWRESGSGGRCVRIQPRIVATRAIPRLTPPLRLPICSQPASRRFIPRAAFEGARDDERFLLRASAAKCRA